MTTQERLDQMKSLPGAPNNRRRRLLPLTRPFVSESERNKRSKRMKRYWANIQRERAA